MGLYVEDDMASKLKDDSGIYFDAKRYLSEHRLRLLSLESVGFMVGLFSLLKESPRVGLLCDPTENSLPMSRVQLSLLTGRTQDVVDRAIAEILGAQLLATSSEGILYDPEMMRQHQVHVSRSKSGSAGGKKRVAREILLKQTLEQNLKQTSSKDKGEVLNSPPSLFENENPIPGGQCAPSVGHQDADAWHQDTEEILLKQTPEQNEGGVLPKQTLEQNREAVVELLTDAWCEAMSAARAPDSRPKCRKAFNEALDQGIPAEMIFAEIALGAKTKPPRNRREWLNVMLDRLLKQTGFTAGSTQAGPALAEASPIAGEEAPAAEPVKRRSRHPGPASWLAEQQAKERKIG